jgi:hypothetical protein
MICQKKESVGRKVTKVWSRIPVRRERRERRRRRKKDLVVKGLEEIDHKFRATKRSYWFE